MKSHNKKTLFSAPLLTLVIAAAACSFATAQGNAGGNSVPRERSETTQPGDRTPSSAQQARDGVNQTNQQAQGQAQGRAQSQQPGTDPTQTPGQQACENSHAPTGSPSIAENESAQGGNPQANANAQGSRADEHQSTQGAENSRAELAQAGDDCLDVNSTLRERNEDARGQGTGNDPGDRDAGRQTREPQG